MDIYFLSVGVRVIGGYDRTDLVLFDREADVSMFEVKVASAGLFILS
jgi:hypothetical protein